MFSSPTSTSNNNNNNNATTSNNNSSLSLLQPTEFDILCGKDKKFAKHRGNVLFKERIEQLKMQYLQASDSKQQKMQMTRDIVTYMQQTYGSRFVKPVDEKVQPPEQREWVEISSLTARDKVSHALRFAARHVTQAERDALGAAAASSSMNSSSAVSSASSSLTTSTTSIPTSLASSLASTASAATIPHQNTTAQKAAAEKADGDDDDDDSVEESDDDQMAEEMVPMEEEMFQRQQRLLRRSMQRAGAAHHHSHNHVSHKPSPLKAFQQQHLHSGATLSANSAASGMSTDTANTANNFNTLRSEDLNEIMNDVTTAGVVDGEDEWNSVEKMAMEC